MLYELNGLRYAVLIGIGATVFMDLWAIFVKQVFHVPSLNYSMVGRWIGHFFSGQYFHQNIQQSPAIKYESALGWLAHYVIGILFGIVLLGLMGLDWLGQPTFLPCLAFGCVTLVFPYFILQPAFGAGIAAAKTPAPNTMRFRSLMAHISFGVGLYLSAVLLQWCVI